MLSTVDESAKLQSAIDYLQPSEIYDEWCQCVIALKSAGVDEATAKAWSTQASNRSEQDFYDTWRSAKPAGKTTIGTFYWYAQRAGWKYQPSRSATPKASLALQQTKPKAEPIPPPPPTPELQERMANYIREYTQQADIERAIPYLESRGFSADVASKYHIGLRDNILVLPYPDDNYCQVRDITIAPNGEKTDKPKYRPPIKGFHSHLFNTPALNAGEQVVFITEGVFDTISINETGAQSVATPHTSTLINALQANGTTAEYFIIAPDNDENQAGAKKAEKHLNALIEAGYKAIICPLPEGFHDCNDCFKRDYSAFIQWRTNATSNAEQLYREQEEERKRAEEALIEAEKERLKMEFAETNLLTRYAGIVETWKAGLNIPTPTGFPSLDEVLDGGLYAGLYTAGAISSLGKTTLVLQIANNIAATGRDVLYFALEMSAGELAAKMLSRLTREVADELGKPEQIAWTFREITNKTEREKKQTAYTGTQAILDEAEARFKAIAEHMFITDNAAKVRVTQKDPNERPPKVKAGEMPPPSPSLEFTGIAEELARYFRFNPDKKPVVFIDYLQILSSPTAKYMTDKQIVDSNVVALKDLSRKHHIPIFLISSFNRENYNKEADLNAFKESGAIEFTSDVVIALQPSGMTIGETQNAITENKRRREETRNSKEKSIEAKVLKNRHGAQKTISFLFQGMYHRFIDKGIVQKTEQDKSTYDTKASRELQLVVFQMLSECREAGRELTLEELATQFKTTPANIRVKCAAAGVVHNGKTISGVMTRAEYEASKERAGARVQRF